MELQDAWAHADYWTRQSEKVGFHLLAGPDPELQHLFELAEEKRINFTAEALIMEAFQRGTPDTARPTAD